MQSEPITSKQESTRTSIYFLLLRSSAFLCFMGRRKKAKLGVIVWDMTVDKLLSKAEIKFPLHSPHNHPGTAPDPPTTTLQGTPL